MKARVRGMGWVTVDGLGRGREAGAFSLREGILPPVTRKDVFSEPYNRFGRLDEFSRLGLAAIALALQDAGLDQWEAKRNIGIVSSTCFGCLKTDLAYYDTVIPDGGALASPNLFAYTLSNCFLGEAAIRFGLTGSGFVINEEDSQRLGGLRMAMESLAWGEADLMLAGFNDLEPPPELSPASSVAPGAVFLVLGVSDVNALGAELLLDKDGALSVSGAPVDDWAALVGACRSLQDTGSGR